VLFSKWVSNMSSQIEMVSLEDLVDNNHNYRKFNNLVDFDGLSKKHLSCLVTDNNYKGYGIDVLFRVLLLQFLEDLSDRELAKFLTENNSAKWFCGFSLSAKTPTYSVFSKLRTKIGTNLLSKMFTEVKEQLKAQGYMNEVFTFIDASHLISKASLWEERDKAIEKKHKKLNNETLPKVATDKQARIGCKGKNKFWYGYKKSVSVDMQSGLINKVSLTPANVTDAKAMKYVLPSNGAVYADKGYATKQANKEAIKKGCVLKAVKKNNMKGKNYRLDSFITKMRSPYERVFSKSSHRVRYKGIAKNQFALFMESLVFNMKRMVVLHEEYGF